MGLFDIVDFGPSDVKAVANGTATRRQIMVILTSQTCGDACWHAREDVCRCSCGGKNHGCLTHGGERPERTSKIDGEVYKLAGVGKRGDLIAEARKINNQQWRSVERPSLIIDSIGSAWTQVEIDEAKARGANLWWSQYKYTWSETDAYAPARLKSVTASQRKWTELSGWQDERDLYMLWVRVTMPEPPTTPVVDKVTGLPLADQTPAYRI